MVISATVSLMFGFPFDKGSNISKMFLDFAKKYPEILNISISDLLNYPNGYPDSEILKDQSANEFLCALAFCEDDKDLNQITMYSCGDPNNSHLFCTINDSYYAAYTTLSIAYTRILPSKLTSLDEEFSKKLIQQYINKFDNEFKCPDFMFGWYLIPTWNNH
jgi:hypothetical protein